MPRLRLLLCLLVVTLVFLPRAGPCTCCSHLALTGLTACRTLLHASQLATKPICLFSSPSLPRIQALQTVELHELPEFAQPRLADVGHCGKNSWRHCCRCVASKAHFPCKLCLEFGLKVALTAWPVLQRARSTARRGCDYGTEQARVSLRLDCEHRTPHHTPYS